MGQLVQDRRRDKLLNNVQNFSIAGTMMPSAWVKVDYDVHTNVYKIGMVYMVHKSMAVTHST